MHQWKESEKDSVRINPGRATPPLKGESIRFNMKTALPFSFRYACVIQGIIGFFPEEGSHREA